MPAATAMTEVMPRAALKPEEAILILVMTLVRHLVRHQISLADLAGHQISLIVLA